MNLALSYNPNFSLKIGKEMRRWVGQVDHKRVNRISAGHIPVYLSLGFITKQEVVDWFAYDSSIITTEEFQSAFMFLRGLGVDFRQYKTGEVSTKAYLLGFSAIRDRRVWVGKNSFGSSRTPLTTPGDTISGLRDFYRERIEWFKLLMSEGIEINDTNEWFDYVGHNIRFTRLFESDLMYPAALKEPVFDEYTSYFDGFHPYILDDFPTVESFEQHIEDWTSIQKEWMEFILGHTKFKHLGTIQSMLFDLYQIQILLNWGSDLSGRIFHYKEQVENIQLEIDFRTRQEEHIKEEIEKAKIDGKPVPLDKKRLLKELEYRKVLLHHAKSGVLEAIRLVGAAN